MTEMSTHTHTHTHTHIFTMSNLIDEKLIMYFSLIYFFVLFTLMRNPKTKNLKHNNICLNKFVNVFVTFLHKKLFYGGYGVPLVPFVERKSNVGVVLLLYHT
jgi:hypothetical protein